MGAGAGVGVGVEKQITPNQRAVKSKGTIEETKRKKGLVATTAKPFQLFAKTIPRNDYKIFFRFSEPGLGIK